MDMGTIRLSNTTQEALEAIGKFGDTHDSIIRGLLGMEIDRKKPKAKRGTGTQRQRYRPQILRYLRSQPLASALASNVIAEIERQMRHEFTADDYDTLSGGVSRWSNRVQWERQSMVDDGLLEPVEASGRGYWKLTEKGRTAADGL